MYLVLETIFWFYMDVVDNNDFLHVFHVFGCWKQYLDFTWMLMDFLRVFHVFSCWKQYLDFTWVLWIIMTFFMYLVWKTIFRFYMDVVDNNDFLFLYLMCWKHFGFYFSCIWLAIFRFYLNVVDKNDFLRVFHVFDCWKQYLHFTWMLW